MNLQDNSLKLYIDNIERFSELSLFELLSQTAKQYPKKIAVSCAGREITYAELKLLSDKFAAALADLGIEKGDRAALYLPNIPQFIIAYYGILKAGAIVTPINSLYKEREVEYQLVDSEAKTLITTHTLYPIVEKIRQKTNIQSIILTGINEYAAKPNGTSLNAENSVFCFQGLLKKPLSYLKVKVAANNDLALLQYTGGTTGTAKAAMLTHKNLVINAFLFATWIKSIVGKEVFLTALPLSHIYGLTTSLNVPVMLAATMVLLPRFEPVSALDAIQQHKVTVFCGVPTMYQVLLAHPKSSNCDLTSIHVCISGASPLPPSVQKQFMRLTGGLLAEGYGLTEASPVTHCNPVDITLRAVKIGSIGLTLPYTEAKIVDTAKGTCSLPAGEVGELVIRGPQVMKGYWKNPEETVITLRDGWLYTGDLAYTDADGYFYLTGRKKDLIKHKGYSIYPREIEDVLYEHPAVKLCAVVGKPDLLVGEKLKAYVVLKEAVQVPRRELTEFVNKKVAQYKALSDIEFRQNLPVGSAGKILRRLLKEEK